MTIQDLLDQEANIANSGGEHSEARVIIHDKIRVMRGTEHPVCFGDDDCSTNILSKCPWRMDCGV